MSALNRREALHLAAAAGLGAVGSPVRAAPSTTTPLLRLSVLGVEAYAPTEGGNLVLTAYDAAQKTGRLGSFRLSDGTLAQTDSEFRRHIARELRDRVPEFQDGPIVFLVHGFLGDPREDIDPLAPQRTNNPHDFAFHFAEKDQPHWRHTTSWPRGLGFEAADRGKTGLVVGFGWNSTPDLFTKPAVETLAAMRSQLSARDQLELIHDLPQLAPAIPAAAKALREFRKPLDPDAARKLLTRLDDILTDIDEPLVKVARKLPGIYSEPYARAPAAAWVLVNALRAVAQTNGFENRPIDLFCHSLGSRVVIQAIHQMATKALENDELKKLLKQIGRIVFVGGAEYVRPAREMLAAVRKVLPDGGPEFFNFMARRDRVLSLLAQRLHPVDPKLKQVIGQCGIGPARAEARWLDLQLDAAIDGKHPLNEWLRPKGFTVAGTHRSGVLNHWYDFTGAENLRVYRAILRDDRAGWEIAKLRQAGIPEADAAPCPADE